MGLFHDGNTSAIVTNEDLGITPPQMLEEFYLYEFLACSNPQAQLFDKLFAEFERIEQMLPAFAAEGVLDTAKYSQLAGGVFAIYTTLQLNLDTITVRINDHEIRTSDDNFTILLEAREFARDLWLRYYQKLLITHSA